MDTIKHPYENESETLTLDDFTIENREDRLSLYGSLDLTRDKAGLALAKRLQALLDAAVAKLSSENLPDRIKPDPPATVKNPF